ncbi:MAG: hypothetical protein ACRD7E_15870 [Bryobacteraceae bacterium]
MEHTSSALLIVIGLASQSANEQVSKTAGQVTLAGTALVVVDPQGLNETLK